MKLPPKLEKSIDVIGMLTALITDLTMNIICFLLLAPDMLTAVAFALIGVMIVLFVFRSWSKGQIFAWLIFVLVVFFFDYSLALEATNAQTARVAQTVDLTVEYAKDPELTRLLVKQQETSTALADLRLQYREAVKRETLDEIDAQIGVKETEGKYFEEQYQKQRALVEARVAKDAQDIKLTSKAIFGAIPNAWKDKRYTELIVYGLIFFGLQLIVVTSIDPLRKNKPKIKKSGWLDALNQLASSKILAHLESSIKPKPAPVKKQIQALEKQVVATVVQEPTPDTSPQKEVQAAAPEVPSTPAIPVRELAKPPSKAKAEVDDIAERILTPVRDNELKSPDAIAYETSIGIDSINRFLTALSQAKGPAGRELLYQKDGKWYLGYTKDMVLASIRKTSSIFNNIIKET